MNLKVLIVEDELMIAEMLLEMLKSEGVTNVYTASTFSEGLQLLANHVFDLVFMDVQIGEGKTGIDLASIIRSRYDTNIIFTTSYSDPKTLQSIAFICPDMYISKPYRISDIRAALNIVYQKRYGTETITIKSGGDTINVAIRSIKYLKADNIYLVIHCDDRRLLVRSTMESFLEEHKSAGIHRTHRSYAVRMDHVDRYEDGTIYIDLQEIPVSKSNRKDFLQLYNEHCER